MLLLISPPRIFHIQKFHLLFLLCKSSPGYVASGFLMEMKMVPSPVLSEAALHSYKKIVGIFPWLSLYNRKGAFLSCTHIYIYTVQFPRGHFWKFRRIRDNYGKNAVKFLLVRGCLRLPRPFRGFMPLLLPPPPPHLAPRPVWEILKPALFSLCPPVTLPL